MAGACEDFRSKSVRDTYKDRSSSRSWSIYTYPRLAFFGMATLAETWAKLPGLAERGASGRLVIGPVSLQRADLSYNWNVVGHAIVWNGTRPGVEPLTDVVEDFYHMTRMRGKPPASRSLFAHCIQSQAA